MGKSFGCFSHSFSPRGEKDVCNFWGIRVEGIVGTVYGMDMDTPLVSVDFGVEILGVPVPLEMALVPNFLFPEVFLLLQELEVHDRSNI